MSLSVGMLTGEPLVMFGGPGCEELTLDTAAAAFNLSPSETALAMWVAKGNSL